MLPLVYNYNEAKKSGLPVLVCPVNPANPVWMVIVGIMRKFMHQRLPAFIWKRIKYSVYGWHALDPESHAPVFMLVTPANNELWVGDPEVADMVLAMRKQFVQSSVTKRELLCSCLVMVYLAYWWRCRFTRDFWREHRNSKFL